MPPIRPMLAKTTTLEKALAQLPYVQIEPKWDGYRAILERTREGCRVWSRNGADLTAGFPDIVDAACAQLQPGTVVDGELVVWSEGRLDFAARPGGWPTAAAAGHRLSWRLRPFWPSTSWPPTTPTCGGSRCG